LPISYPLFDSHCHFDFDEFGGEVERANLWAQCQSEGLNHLLIPGVSPQQWPHAFRLAKSLSGLVMAVGVHPWWVKDMPNMMLDDSQLEQMHYYINSSYCVAIGECGLDAMIDLTVKDQQPIFEQQTQFACESGRPLIIHVRKTHSETLTLLKRYQPSAGGVIHGFTGSEDLARQYWALGFYLGVGGSITYPRANKTRQAIQSMPMESLLLETDAPDMPLNGYQGQINTPRYLSKVAKSLAGLKGIPLDVVCKITTENAHRLFILPQS